jgi:hypothetical protein
MITRWLGRVLAMAALGGSTSTALAQPRLAAVAEARTEVGTGDVSGIILGIGGPGVELWAAPTLRVRASALILAATGESTDERHAHSGAGGEITLILLPLPTSVVRPFLRGSGGLLLFLDDPFLPGGDIYEFILGLGGGLEVDSARA